ncbi:tripartite tricarboxylate transporter substrate-binding protein [Mesorhizobium sp.]|uniref:tripartite tricarboxylate transporter substrate-binding protein n=1 Tax=Mesorhizobium sp. TaxID=1871066 RepID=UPI000FE90B0D|nr:tripartite tricarboxylate transporter substrate-binding protein [Mesorhizobium sp.]RWK56306.1 MAG: tripartite tricarboxylate transporter substrate binding protein BugD [Mesorhizobium sp.]TIP48996.1 MAG: tripartite tricarboxylate transporter substrate binding protein BugD [Mesorhizobium sp.]
MRRLLAAALASAFVIFTGSASAQEEYPNRPITILVPAAAGGPSDTVARLVAEAMRVDLGQQVLVENVGGAGGSLGAGRVASAEPDGYTLLLYHIGVSTFAALYPDLAYKPIEAFDSVGLVTEVPMTLVGKKDLPPQDVGSLLAYLKGEGAGATFGTAGVGAASDLCGKLLTEATGINLTVVPYKGTGPAMTDLVGGQIDLMCDQTTNTINQIKAGEIKSYAVTTKARIDALPDLPTLNESGVKDFEVTAWHAIWTPKGTPEAIRSKLSASLQKALATPKLIERFAALGTVPVAPELATPAALEERFHSEVERWGKLLSGK